ncbi:MAG: hypothetical protein AAF199_03465, partial [Pseudomonadota bacterium]
MRVSALISVIILVLAAALFSLGDFSKDNPDVNTQSAVQFAGTFLALSDTDMAGTAYADGQLEPIDAIDT